MALVCRFVRLCGALFNSVSMEVALWRQVVALLLAFGMCVNASGVSFETRPTSVERGSKSQTLDAPPATKVGLDHARTPSVPAPTESKPVLFASLLPRLPRQVHATVGTPQPSGASAIASNFNGTGIAAGTYIWLNSVFSVGGITSYPARVVVRGGVIQFTANGQPITVAVPDAVITYSNTATVSSTQYDASAHQWNTTIPAGLSGNAMLTSVPVYISKALPGGINPVTWTENFYSDHSGVSVQWKWAAAVYTSFASDPNLAGVKPFDGSAENPYPNSDHAGTPENFKSYVVGGARGGGGSNWTGSYSGTASLSVPVDTAPVANAGSGQTVPVGTIVTLDGSKSSDANGDPLSYEWSIVQAPTGSAAQPSNASSVNAKVTIDKPGDYVFQLVVNDGVLSSVPAQVTVSTSNSAPVAVAGNDQKVLVGGTAVQLDGSKSYDIDSDPFTYRWTLVTPSGSTAALDNPTAVQPKFTPDVIGDYTVTLIVNDGKVDSQPSTLTVTSGDLPPIANAGPAQTAKVGATVTLDGSQSYDPDQQQITYQWSITTKPTGSTAMLSGPTSSQPTMVVDAPGHYVIQLIASDGYLPSQASTTTVDTVNSQPVANAGPDQTIDVGQTVQLDGSGSTDVDGNALSYTWSLATVPSSSNAQLSNLNAVKPTFIADVPGTYIAQLIVNDGTVSSTPVTVTITSNDVPPVANPGLPKSVNVGSTVNLDGSASTDSDGRPLSYTWAFVSRPANSTATLSQPTSVTPYFIADVAGTYIIQLIVSDGFLSSNPATVVVSTINTVPVANPGPDQTVGVGSTVQLSGAASSDADGDPITYSWAMLTKPSGSTAILSSATIVNPTLVPDLPGTYVVQLIVDDGIVNSSPATVTITATPQNQPPVVDAGPNQTITLPNSTVTLNGTATDDGLPNHSLLLSWSVVSGPGTVTFSSPDAAVTQATFSSAGTYVLQLTANDSQLSASATTKVTVNNPANQAPVVKAGPNQVITLPTNSVMLNGTATDDGLPSGTLTINWSVVSGPGPVTFSSPNAAKTNATFSVPGTYVLQLTANDSQLSSNSQVTITVKPVPVNQAPVVNAGPNQAVTLGISTVTLNGTATDDGLPNGTLLVSWSQLSGPTTVTFSSPNTPATQARFTASGLYLLQLSATDTQLTSTSQMTVYVYTSGSNGQNQPPYVNAGPDQTTTIPAPVQLNGVAVDDGLPNGTLQVVWSMLSGPGTVTFGSPTNPVTSASFSVGGTYVLQLSANDSASVSSSTVTINVEKLYGHGGYKGTDFWVMFPQNSDNGASAGGGTVFQPQLVLTSEVANSGTVTIPGQNFSSNFNVAAGQAVVVPIPKSAVMGTIDQVENKGIRVIAQSEVTVVGLSYYTAASDGYLALPTPVLGTNYIVLAWPKTPFSGSEFGIVAPYDGTTVTITPSVNVAGHVAGQPYSVVLNQGRTYQIISNGQGPSGIPPDDLTGTAINSDKPIAVFSGNQCANIPADPGSVYRYCNHVLEELPPTDVWGQNFLTVPIATHQKGEVFRVLAANDNTTVSIDGSPVATLNHGEYYQTILTAASSINSDGPVLVAQFETSEEYETNSPFNGNFLGDPSMFLVPPYQQFGGHYTVLTPTTGFRANYVNVVAPTTAVSSLTMDGAPLPANFTAIPNSTYSGAQVPVGTGVHHFDGAAPFGVTLYGLDAYDTYSYQAGLEFDAARTGTTISLTPTSVSQQTGTQLCVTASLYDGYRNPAGGTGVGFTVAGANPSSGSVDTNSFGQAQFCYVGVNSGTDTIVESIGSVTSSITIVWNANNPNRSPVVFAGNDSVITLPATLNLYGVVSDDGLPSAPSLTTTWSVVSGPGSVSFGNSSQPITTATFSAAGTYDLRLTASDSQLNSYADIMVTVNPVQQNQVPVVNAGTNITTTLPASTVTLNGIATDDGLPAGAKLAVQWTQVSGPGAVVFSNATTASTQATFPQAGTYVLQLAADDSQLSSSSTVTATVITLNKPPSVNCPGVASITLPTTTQTFNCSATDDGLPVGSALTLQWAMKSGPAPVTFSNPTAASTQATFSAAGQYYLTLSGTDGQLTSVATLSFFVNPANQPPAVSVTNSYQTISLPTSTVTLSATVTDDGQPTGGTLTQLWSQTNGPAAATIATPTQTSTQLTFATAGTYNFAIAASDSQLATTAYATVIVNPANKAPVVSAGPNLTVSLPSATLTLNGSVTDDGLPSGAAVTGTWSEVSGPGPVTFTNPTSAVTQVTFTTAGTYDLRLSASDTQLTGSADVSVTVYPAPQNQPPVVSAGKNQTLYVGQSTYMTGSAADDGLPTGSHLTVSWSQVSGPAQAVIYNYSSPGSYVNFPAVGVYVLQLSANDTQYTATSTVTITALAYPNQAPSVSATYPQTITLPNGTVTLAGRVTDDGLPNGTLTENWVQVSGPSPVVFATPNQPVTQATFISAGSYQLRLFASDSQLTSYADVSITVQPANSGPVISVLSGAQVTLPSALTLNGSVTEPNLPQGATLIVQWTELSGAGPVTFSNPNSASTQVTFSTAGFYNLQLWASDGQITSNALVQVNAVAAAPAAPKVSLLYPSEGMEVTKPIQILGTVNAPYTTTWKLDYSLNTNESNLAAQTWVSIPQTNGGSPLFDAPLASLDPTTMLKGTYTLRLTATDNYGQTAVDTTTFVVDKNTQVGRFTMTFNDLTVPVAGLPITITRTYDSYNHQQGDFGVGWTLGIANVRLTKNRSLAKNWNESTTQTGYFPQTCLQTAGDAIVTVTFPDGRFYKFQAISSPQCSLGPITAPTLSFTELPGSPGTSGATLVPADGGGALLDGPVPGNVNLIDYNSNPYNPTVFRLNTADGYVYVIDQNAGVTSMSDPNGNTLTISASGITSSTGKSVTFTRDGQNRITKITDPNGNVLKYNYPFSSWPLDTFTDASNNTTTFYYTQNGGSQLYTFSDPRGIYPIRNDYDGAGHLYQTTDANGKIIKYKHDLTGQVETITDRLGNPTTYSYDTDGNITSETDALGNTTTKTFDLNDNKLSETNALGKTTTYTYDGNGNRTSGTDPLGNKTTYTYNARGQVLTVADPQGLVTTNVYDLKGNLLSTTDPNGKVTSTEYDANGLPKTVTDASGKITTFQYTSGNLTQQTDALGNVTTYNYDANNDKLSQTVTRTVNGQPQTLTTGYKYDAANRLKETDYPDGTSTQIQYNSIGKQSVTIDQLNRQTSYTYDSMGRLTTTTYPDNTTLGASYDAENHRLSSTDRAGNTTNYAYDNDGRLYKTTYADQSFTQKNYDTAGRVSSTVDTNGNTTSYGYDDAGRRTSITDAANQVTTFTYDASGNQTSVKDANHNLTKYDYDSLNRQTKVTYPDQTFSSTSYDALGRVISKTDQAGKITGYGYDDLGRLTSVTQDVGGVNLVTTYGYDEVGNRISQTDANNHITTYNYDKNGRRIGRTLPLGQSESYTYDVAGNLKTKIDFNGKTTTYGYDSSNRLMSKTPDPSFNAAAISFTYTNNGLRKTMSDPSGMSTYAYDNRNRLKAKQTPFGTLSYTYDSANNVLTITSSNANGISDTYTYDALNRLSTVSDTSGQTTYSYDNVGNLQGYTYPNGAVTSYNYDQLNRLTQMGSAKGGALTSYTYTLGAAGNHTSVADLSGRTVNYGYDSLYRLTSETIATDPAGKNGTVVYVYDAVGNRQHMSSTLNAIPAGLWNYDANDRMTVQGVSDPAYDNDGNTVAQAGITNSYDFENHLIQHGAVTVVYDGDGNRVSETVGGVTTNYLVDTQNPTGYAQVVDELQNGVVTRTYSYGLERISESQTLNSAWRPSFYGYDGHGSVRFLMGTNGVITDTYDYDAFGNLINSTGSTPNNYLFAGEQFDRAVGLYYNRARYLDVRVGRFWGTDNDEGDSEAPSSLHKYLYAGADPVNHRDQSGNDFDIGSTLAASSGFTTIFGMSTVQSAIVIHAVTGGLFAASLSGFGAALEGKSPDQIESATGNPINIALGALTAIGGSAVSAYKLGGYALALISLGAGGSAAYNQYQQGNYAAAIYYGTLGTLGGVLSGAVPYLRGSTQTPPTVVLKGPNPNVVPSNLSEQLALEEAEANAGEVIFAPGQLGDAPRLEANYGTGQWAKAEWVHYCSGGTVCLNANGEVIRPDAGNYTVHYFINLITGERVEFKFTNTP